MQKALVVRALLDEQAGRCWSQEVDAAPDSKPRLLHDWLGDGWRVVHTCPMPSDLDNCCLVLLEKSEGERAGPAVDAPLSALNHHSAWQRLHARPHLRTPRAWDGETVSLDAFGLTEP